MDAKGSRIKTLSEETHEITQKMRVEPATVTRYHERKEPQINKK
jgi:hypothetical protein